MALNRRMRSTLKCPSCMACPFTAQDENNVYFSAYIMTPENRGIFRLPFKVNLNGQTEAYTGSVTTSAYSAQATIRVSDVRYQRRGRVRCAGMGGGV